MLKTNKLWHQWNTMQQCKPMKYSYVQQKFETEELSVEQKSQR